MRDPFQLKMLHKALENMKPNIRFQERRALICIMLLYITGCRINELRNFNYRMINNLYENGTIRIMSYKTKMARRIDISDKQRVELKKIMHLVDEFYTLIPTKSHVLSKKDGKEMSNLSAIRWMNKCLKELTKGDDINIKSHSFRINYVTGILKNYPVNIAQTIIGHKSIDTTIRYDRNMLSSDKVKQILNSI